MNILLAEDDDSSRLLMSEFVGSLGHQVRAARNGMELVRLAFEARPDLILTDLHMPEMGGSSMIAMIDMYPDLAGIPVIVVSGATRAEIDDMGIPREIKVLSKPYDLGTIEAAIAAVSAKGAGS